MKLLLKIAYLGGAYCGYQVQPNGVTVQEQLNIAARALFGGECDIVGCSRTDSGVHARGFCAAVTRRGTSSLETSIPAERIPRALNVLLPEDISVRSACFVREEFHPRYDVVAKEYEYLIHNGATRDPFLLSRAWHLPQPIGEEALARMQQAAGAFVGRHDFSAMRDKEAGGTADTVREVFSAAVTRQGEQISFRVCATGFLYHMVRIMVGTLVSVARGGIDPAALPSRIAAGDRRLLGETAPACGLYLDRVIYREDSGIHWL